VGDGTAEEGPSTLAGQEPVTDSECPDSSCDDDSVIHSRCVGSNVRRADTLTNDLPVLGDHLQAEDDASKHHPDDTDPGNGTTPATEVEWSGLFGQHIILRVPLNSP
jgi:hypothetical protein